MSKKLHYDKEALIKEYKKTFVVMTIATAVVVAFAVIFFFVMAAYLGEVSHTKHGPYFDTFEKDGRIEGSYDGLKLKSHEVVNPEVNEEYYNKKPHVKGTITH
jgi:hypothetical protein